MYDAMNDRGSGELVDGNIGGRVLTKLDALLLQDWVGLVRSPGLFLPER